MPSPTWIPSSPFLVNHTGLSIDTSSGSQQPFSAGDLTAALDGGDFFFRGTFTPNQDWLTTVNAGLVVYFFNMNTPGGNIALRFDPGTSRYTMTINGVDKQQIYGAEGNVLSFSSSGGQIDPVVLDFQWLPSLGRAGHRFHVNNSDNHCFDGLQNLQSGFPANPGYANGVVQQVGDVVTLVPPTGQHIQCTAGATTASLSIGHVLDPNNGNITLASSAGQGSTFTDGNGTAWKNIPGEIPVGAALSAPTSFFLGSKDGTQNFFPVTWSQVSFMRHGSQIEPATSFVVLIGDSQITSWVWTTSAGSRLRTVLQTAGNPVIGMCAWPGIELNAAAGSPSLTMLLNSKWALLGAAGLMKGYVIQLGTNDLIAGRTAAQIIADMQALITTGIRSFDTTSPIFLCQIPYERGAITAGQYAVWLLVNTAFAGGGGTPVTDPVGTNIVYVPGATANSSQVNPPPAGTDFLSASSDVGDGAHENPLGRTRLGQTIQTALATKGLGTGG